MRLCDDFEALNAQRNQLFHGEWRFVETNKAFVLKRSHTKEAKRASYQGAWVTPQQVVEMTELYRKLQNGLDGYISEAMAHRQHEPPAAVRYIRGGEVEPTLAAAPCLTESSLSAFEKWRGVGERGCSWVGTVVSPGVYQGSRGVDRRPDRHR